MWTLPCATSLHFWQLFSIFCNFFSDFFLHRNPWNRSVRRPTPIRLPDLSTRKPVGQIVEGINRKIKSCWILRWRWSGMTIWSLRTLTSNTKKLKSNRIFQNDIWVFVQIKYKFLNDQIFRSNNSKTILTNKHS